MRYIYFTKHLRELDLPGIIRFLKDAGLDGADLAVRPDYPVNPDNVLDELPRAAKAFAQEGLTIGLATAPTTLDDAGSRPARAIFEACQKSAVPAVKIGYFAYRADFEKTLSEARRRLDGFAKLAAATGVKACYHTHSGNFFGNNGAGLRWLLQDFDPHHVGAFLDTGHVALNGGPFPMELDLVRPWLSLVAVKDIAWQRQSGRWEFRVVPAGEGIVRWSEVARALRDGRFQGTLSLHAEYHETDLSRRKELARRERDFLQKLLAAL